MNTEVVMLILGISVPVLTVGTTYFSERLASRDDRLRIKADLELYEAIPEEFGHRDALKGSIERLLDHASPYTGFTGPQYLALLLALVIGASGFFIGLSWMRSDATSITGWFVYGSGATVMLVALTIWSVAGLRVLDARERSTPANETGSEEISAA